uniref:Secreted protein n=1 Tax=Anopheles darlingi TaxID=43151 RepID=A0A2M4D2L4_ANODA
MYFAFLSLILTVTIGAGVEIIAFFCNSGTVPCVISGLYTVTILIYFRCRRGSYIRCTDRGSCLQVRGTVRISYFGFAIAVQNIVLFGTGIFR